MSIWYSTEPPTYQDDELDDEQYYQRQEPLDLAPWCDEGAVFDVE